jgi:DNA-binding NarL/FixJ family response regulator
MSRPDGHGPGGGITRVLLADDHALVRRGVRLILDAEPDFEVVAEAGDGAEAIELPALVGGPDPDLVDARQ